MQRFRDGLGTGLGMVLAGWVEVANWRKVLVVQIGRMVAVKCSLVLTAGVAEGNIFAVKTLFVASMRVRLFASMGGQGVDFG